MGGCPAGSGADPHQRPEHLQRQRRRADSITVSWDAAPRAPAPAVTGYTVRTVAPDGVDERGKRLSADARSTTISGLTPDGIYTSRSPRRATPGEGTPSVISRVRAAEHVVPTATATTARRPDVERQVRAARHDRQR